MLLLLRGSCLQLVCRQAAAGLQELLRTAAGCVSSPADWAVLFTLLECVGAGARPPAVRAGHAAAAEPGQWQISRGSWSLELLGPEMPFLVHDTESWLAPALGPAPDALGLAPTPGVFRLPRTSSQCGTGWAGQLIASGQRRRDLETIIGTNL